MIATSDTLLPSQGDKCERDNTRYQDSKSAKRL